jgi:hypothetical protein
MTPTPCLRRFLHLLKLLKVYNFCNLFTARKMVGLLPHMAAYLPCGCVRRFG